MTRTLAFLAVVPAILLGCGDATPRDDWRGTLAPRTDGLAGSSMPPAAGASFDPKNPAASGLSLTFYDEFDDLSLSDDGAAHRTRWTDHLWYQPAPSAPTATAHDGVLDMAITRQGEKWTESDLSSVDAAGKGFAQKYGYFEARIKLSGGRGAWGSFWLMSLDHALRGEAVASEIDILESAGGHIDRYSSTLHRATADTGGLKDAFNRDHEIRIGYDLSQDFHTFAVLWPPHANHLTFYLDGRPALMVPKYDTTDSAPMMVFLSLVTYEPGSTDGPDATTPETIHMLVKYVRVWRFPGEAATN